MIETLKTSSNDVGLIQTLTRILPVLTLLTPLNVVRIFIPQELFYRKKPSIKYVQV